MASGVGNGVLSADLSASGGGLVLERCHLVSHRADAETRLAGARVSGDALGELTTTLKRSREQREVGLKHSERSMGSSLDALGETSARVATGDIDPEPARKRFKAMKAGNNEKHRVIDAHLDRVTTAADAGLKEADAAVAVASNAANNAQAREHRDVDHALKVATSVYQTVNEERRKDREETRKDKKEAAEAAHRKAQLELQAKAQRDQAELNRKQQANDYKLGRRTLQYQAKDTKVRVDAALKMNKENAHTTRSMSRNRAIQGTVIGVTQALATGAAAMAAPPGAAAAAAATSGVLARRNNNSSSSSLQELD